MRAIATVIVLVAGFAISTMDCRQVQPQQWSEDDIPARCAALSVTPVSCEQLPPDNLLPHPDDCELFYYCVSPGGPPVCRQCPAHLHFNPHLLVCDNPDSAGCSSRMPILP